MFGCKHRSPQTTPISEFRALLASLLSEVIEFERWAEIKKIIYAHVSFVNLTSIWTPFKIKNGYQFSLKSENIEILPILSEANFGQNILPTLFNIYAKSCGNPFGSFRYKWGQRFWHMFIIIIIIRNGAKTISLQTSFGNLIITRWTVS